MYNPLLDCLIYVAETGTFTKAGEIMSISATAVMKQINALEKHLDLKLFNRSNQGVSLTPAGREVYSFAVKIKKSSSDFLEDLRHRTDPDSAVLRIGFSMLRPCEPFLNLWYRIRHQFPAYSLSLVSFSDDLTGWMCGASGAENDFDIAVTVCDKDRVPENMSFLPIGRYGICCAMSRSRDMDAGSRGLPPARLSAEHLRGRTVLMPKRGLYAELDGLRDRLCSEADISIEDTEDLYSHEALAICRNTDKLLISPDCWHGADPSLILFPVEPPRGLTFGLMYREDPVEPVKRVIAAVREEAGI